MDLSECSLDRGLNASTPTATEARKKRVLPAHPFSPLLSVLCRPCDGPAWMLSADLRMRLPALVPGRVGGVAKGGKSGLHQGPLYDVPRPRDVVLVLSR